MSSSQGKQQAGKASTTGLQDSCASSCSNSATVVRF